MKTYANNGHGLATVVFTDGGGIFLKRGEKKNDARTVRWIDKGVKVTPVVEKQVQPKPVESKPVESKDLKTDNTKLSK